MKERVPDTDAGVVAALRSAGALIIGKTFTPPFAADIQTNSPLHGVTFNPVDLSLTSGGSSGGSAAAVGSGCVPLAVGSDLAGSLRIPASYCGIYSIRPSVGRVSTSGCFPRVYNPLSTLVIGALAENVDYLQRFMQSVDATWVR